MKHLVLLSLLCVSCAAQEALYVPEAVSVPVEVPCKAAPVPKPADLLATLTPSTSLTLGLKSCLAQHDYDLGYQSQLEASILACQ